MSNRHRINDGLRVSHIISAISAFPKRRALPGGCPSKARSRALAPTVELATGLADRRRAVRMCLPSTRPASLFGSPIPYLGLQIQPGGIIMRISGWSRLLFGTAAALVLEPCLPKPRPRLHRRHERSGAHRRQRNVRYQRRCPALYGLGNFIDQLVPNGDPLWGPDPCCLTFGPDENLYVSDPFNLGTSL